MRRCGVCWSVLIITLIKHENYENVCTAKNETPQAEDGKSIAAKLR